MLTEAAKRAIKGRKEIGGSAAISDPFLVAYRTRGGYIIATNGRQTDSGKLHDLLYIHPGGGIVVLSPLVNPDLTEAVRAAVEEKVL